MKRLVLFTVAIFALSGVAFAGTKVVTVTELGDAYEIDVVTEERSWTISYKNLSVYFSVKSIP